MSCRERRLDDVERPPEQRDVLDVDALLDGAQDEERVARVSQREQRDDEEVSPELRREAVPAEDSADVGRRGCGRVADLRQQNAHGEEPGSAGGHGVAFQDELHKSEAKRS